MSGIAINDNFRLLSRNYLFAEVAHRIKEYRAQNPTADIIRMDIGDVTRPIFKVVEEAMIKACREQASAKDFHGYGPEQGYESLRQAIVTTDYRRRGLEIDADDVFISDGAKSDLGNLGDIFAYGAIVGVCEPGYPVYTDASVIDGRAGCLHDGHWSDIVYLPTSAADDFEPQLPERRIDVAILCSPHNPTGTCISRKNLEKWVAYAREHGVLIIFDAAYESYVRSKDTVRSIYEIEGAREVAIEVRSFSKSAGFTGLRCGYTVVPKILTGRYADGSCESLNTLWRRRQTTKFNGASYIVQCGAEALYTPEGQQGIKEATDYYLANASLIASTLRSRGYEVWGGNDSPYVWARTRKVTDSWQLFDYLLRHSHVSVTPGVGFGNAGEGFIRLTGFNSRANTEEAMRRLQ